MADFTFRISPNIILGSYTASRLGQFALDWGSRYMLIMDPVLKEVGTANKITQSLTDRKINFFTFEQISKGAETKTIQDALTLARNSHIHGVIAAGGGKVLNVARAVCTLYNEVHDLYDFVDGAVPSTNPLPLLCVPTTIRDAFLFTNNIPVIDSRSSKVKIIKAPGSLCKMVVFDPNLTVSLTENQIHSMSIETLALICESYLSQKSNFFSDMVSEKAAELIGYAIDGSDTLTVTTPQEELLAQGGCMASLAAATSSIGPASLLALCISGRFQISRALTSAILLPYVIEDCAKFKKDRIQKLQEKLRIKPAEGQDEAASELVPLAEYLRSHLAKANLPTRLKDLSVTIEQLSLAVEDAGQLELINSLPRSMTGDDLFNLIKLAF